MKPTPKKVFIKENNTYLEITNEEHEQRKISVEGYSAKRFIMLHEVLLEVDEQVHKEFYSAKNHEEYLEWRTRHREVQYDSFDDDDTLGEEMLIDKSIDMDEQLDLKIISEKIHGFLATLSEKDREVIIALFFEEKTEREYAEKIGISQVAVHKRKVRVLEKFKTFFQKEP